MNPKNPNIPNQPINWTEVREADKVLRACAGISYDLAGLSYLEKQEFFRRGQGYLQDLGEILWQLRGSIKAIREARPPSPYDRAVPRDLERPGDNDLAYGRKPHGRT